MSDKETLFKEHAQVVMWVVLAGGGKALREHTSVYDRSW